MSRKRDEYGPTLQEKRVPTPDTSYHRKAGRRKKGPYVVTACSFLLFEESNEPSYFMVTHVDAVIPMSKRTYWKQFVVHGEGLELTYKAASRLRRALENEYEEKHPRKRRW